jgi:hypothetical protein
MANKSGDDIGACWCVHSQNSHTNCHRYSVVVPSLSTCVRVSRSWCQREDGHIVVVISFFSFIQSLPFLFSLTNQSINEFVSIVLGCRAGPGQLVRVSMNWGKETVITPTTKDVIIRGINQVVRATLARLWKVARVRTSLDCTRHTRLVCGNEKDGRN